MRKIDLIIIHCSATPGDVSAQTIDEWHKERGFNRIGYHYVIRQNGSVEEGRPLHDVGAHCRGYNVRSIGICLAGGVDHENKPVANFTGAQYETLGALVASLYTQFNQPDVLGHNHLNRQKDCPSFDVIDWWDKWRKENWPEKGRKYGFS